VLQQEQQRGMKPLGVDQVIVVQDQQQLVITGLGCQLVDQRRNRPMSRNRRQQSRLGRGQLAYPRASPAHRSHGVAPEPCRVVIALVQR
jgi:hypothetical protein